MFEVFDEKAGVRENYVLNVTLGNKIPNLL